MKEIFAFILALLALLGFMNPLHAKVLADGPITSFEARKVKGPRYEEGLVAVNIPIELIRAELRSSLLSEDSPIKELNRLDFDPIKRLIMVEGVILLPDDVLTDLSVTVDQSKDLILKEHRFTITASFGSSQKLAKTRYFSIEFLEFKLGEQDYISAFPILSNFLSIVLANTPVIDYFLGVNEAVSPGDKDALLKVRNFIQSGAIRLKNQTLSVKLDLKKFYDTQRFAKLADLRLWQFRPILLKGSQDEIAFRIEAGLGIPGEEWFKEHKSRVAYESGSLRQVRQAFYSQYLETQPLLDQLFSYLEKVQIQLGLDKNITERDQVELDDIQQRLSSRARDTFSMKNALFEADPQREYDDFKREGQEYILARLADLKRQKMIREKIRNGGRRSNDMPFLTKWLSQDAITQGVHFFRSVKDEKVGQLFPEFHMILNPANSGFHIRGRINMDLTDLLKTGLEGSGVEVGDIPIYAAADMYGKSIPFEINLRSSMADDGWLGLDAKAVSLFDGSMRTTITNDGEHGRFVINFIKMAITQTLATMLIEQTPEEGPGNSEEDEDKSFKELLNNIQKQAKAYHEREDEIEGTDLEFLLSLAKIDIENNPFLTTGEEFVAGKTELFFKELIKYDEEDEQLKFRLNPKIVSESILTSENTVQVWNVEPIYSKSLNNTFLELSLGNKKRSKKYLDYLEKRIERKDSENFTHTDFEKRSPLDLRAKLDLEAFKKMVNGFLSDAYTKQNNDAAKVLKQNKESEYYLIQDLRLDAVSNGSFKIFVTLTHLVKSERWLINPARWFGSKYGPVKKKSIFLSATLGLNVNKLSKYKDGLVLSDDEVFLGDEVLAVDLENVQYTVKGDKTLLDRLVMLVGKNLNLKKGLASKLKGFLINALRGYVHSTEEGKNGNIELNGIKINRYAKILTHKQEILIQLNPHLMGAAFDVRLLANQRFQGEKLGLVLSPRTNEINLDFHTAATMASVDKYDLYQMMLGTVELFKPVLEEERHDALTTILGGAHFYDQAIHRSDITNMSYYNRYLQVMRRYDGILDIRLPDMTQLNAIQAAQGNTFTNADILRGHKKLTTTGAEVIYLLSSGLVLYRQLNKLIQKIDDFELKGKVPYYKDLINKSESLLRDIIRPLIKEYQLSYEENNRRISTKGVTDWNHTFYPDARFADLVFRKIKRLMEDEVITK